MDGLRSLAQRKVGPFALWVWLVVAAAGIALGLAVSRRAARGNGGTDAPGPESSSTGQEGAAVLTPRAAGMVGYAPPPSGALVPPSQTSSGGPTTNRQWSQQAARALTARGAGGVAVEQALAAYLAGSTITTDQRALIDEAISLVGPPPEGSPRVTIAPPPTAPTTPTTPPPVVTEPVQPPPTPPPVLAPAPAPVVAPVARTYTVQPNDNLSWIAEQFYGVQDWQRIFAANRDQLSDPGLIYAGQVLRIP